MDHVLPQSRGGIHEWANVVAACGPCNNKKGNKTPREARMPLLKKPSQPKWLPSKEFAYSKEKKCPQAWRPYLNHLKLA